MHDLRQTSARRRGKRGPLRALVTDEDGQGLIEVLIAVAILSAALMTMLMAISTGSIGIATTQERVDSANLARSQMEYTKSQAYLPAPSSYPTITPPSGYTVSATASAVPGADSAIQLITVTVSRGSETVATVEGFKVDR